VSITTPFHPQPFHPFQGDIAASTSEEDEAAAAALENGLSDHFQAFLRQVLDPQEMLLGLCLALERRKGAASAWHAYCQTLPNELAPAWASRGSCALLEATSLSRADKQLFAADVHAANFLVRNQCVDMAAAWRCMAGLEGWGKRHGGLAQQRLR